MSDDGDNLQGESASSSTPADKGEPIARMNCLGGAPLPEDVKKEAARIDKLNERALKNLPQVLRPCVLLPVTRELAEELSRFALQHEIAEADLGHVLRACRWLLRAASAVALPSEALAADINTIWKEPGVLAEVLLEQYEPIKRELREQLLADALVKHGNVLLDVDWRLDAVVSERHAARLGTPVALVTLAYRDAERGGRLTLQMTHDNLERLSSIFGALAQKMRATSE